MDEEIKKNQSPEKIKELLKDKLRLQKKLDMCESRKARLEELLDKSTFLSDIVTAEHELEITRHQLEVFTKFVPTEFLSSLREDPFLVDLGDHIEKDMCVLFSDIRSYTSISESMSPSENFKFLNDYLARTYHPISDNHGVIDKYIGDAIMALFAKADDAVNAAIQLQKSAYEFDKELPFSFNIGVGIHRGLLMLGIIGVKTRMQSTVIADAVNIASRLETLSSFLGAKIIISESIINEITDHSLYQMRFLGKIKVKGKIQPVKVYEVLQGESEEVFQKKISIKDEFHEALDLFRHANFSKAKIHLNNILKKYPEDIPTMFYLKKTVEYSQSKPPEDWDGSEEVGEIKLI